MRVIVRFTFLGQDIGTISADAQAVSPGLYQLAGEQLSLTGPWKVAVVVRRRGIEDSTANFDWTVAALKSVAPCGDFESAHRGDPDLGGARRPDDRTDGRRRSCVAQAFVTAHPLIGGRFADDPTDRSIGNT